MMLRRPGSEAADHHACRPTDFLLLDDYLCLRPLQLRSIAHLLKAGLVNVNLSSRSQPRPTDDRFHKIARKPFFVVRDGTGRVGERFFLW